MTLRERVEQVHRELYEASGDEGFTVEQRAVYRDASRAVFVALAEDGGGDDGRS